MSKITDKQVVLIKTTVSSKAKQLGINPIDAQNEVKKLAAQLHEHDNNIMSIKDVDSDLFEALLESIDGALNSLAQPFNLLRSVKFSDAEIESIPPKEFDFKTKQEWGFDKNTKWGDLPLETRRQFARHYGKNDVAYVSWASAFDIVQKLYPDMDYEIEKFNGLPYQDLGELGAFVWTSITINNKKRTMWLPIMDSSHNPLRNKPYTVTKKGKDKSNYEVTYQAFTAFDINKTIMRCLVKNLAMFGLGLYVYRGEDMPNVELEQIIFTELSQPQQLQQSISKEQSDNFINQITDLQAQFLPQRKLSEVGKEFIGFINFKYGLQIQSSKEIPASLFEEINSNIENLFKEAFGV